MDPRKGYLISCIRSLLNLEEEPQSLVKSQILDNFLGRADQQSLNLVYIMNKGFKPLKFGDAQPPADSVIISMCKMSAEEITVENMIHALSVWLMPSFNPMSVLQKQVESYFLPALKGSKDSNIQRLLHELCSGKDTQQ